MVKNGSTKWWIRVSVKLFNFNLHTLGKDNFRFRLKVSVERQVLSTNFNTEVDETFMRELRSQQFAGLRIGNRFVNREGIGFKGLYKEH